jgi:hypothetical protein
MPTENWAGVAGAQLASPSIDVDTADIGPADPGAPTHLAGLPHGLDSR